MADRTPYAERVLVASAVVLCTSRDVTAVRLSLSRAYDALNVLQEDWMAARRKEPEDTVFAVAAAVERIRQDLAAGRPTTGAAEVLKAATCAYFAARAGASHAALVGAG